MGYPTSAKATARARSATQTFNSRGSSVPRPGGRPVNPGHGPVERRVRSPRTARGRYSSPKQLDFKSNVLDFTKFSPNVNTSNANWLRYTSQFANKLPWFGFASAAMMLEYMASTYGDIMLPLGEAAPQFPPGANVYCSAGGTHQGVLRGGSCGSVIVGTPDPIVDTYGWQKLPGPTWHWYNWDSGPLYGPGENPENPGIGFPSYNPTVVGHISSSVQPTSDPVWGAPGVRVLPNPHADPRPSPMIDPDIWPPGAPAPVDMPRPWPVSQIPNRQPNPHRPAQGNRGSPKDPRRTYRFKREKRPREQRAGKKTAEKKGQVGGNNYGWAIGWAMMVTEALDFLNALWNAIPRRYRTKGKNGRNPTPQQKFKDIYEAILVDRFDLERAIENVALNALEDLIVGTLLGTEARIWRKAKGGPVTMNPAYQAFVDPRAAELVQEIRRTYEKQIRRAIGPATPTGRPLPEFDFSYDYRPW